MSTSSLLCGPLALSVPEPVPNPPPALGGVPLGRARSAIRVGWVTRVHMTLQDYKARIAAATPLAQLHGSNSNSVPSSMPQTPTRSATSRSHPATPLAVPLQRRALCRMQTWMSASECDHAVRPW